MIFDDFAKLTESHPDLLNFVAPIIQRSALFHFPHKMHEWSADQPLTFDEAGFFNDHFFLPFAAIAIEDTASCVLLWETEPQNGLGNWLYFAECNPLDPVFSSQYSNASKISDEELARLKRQIPKGACGVTCGRIKYLPFELDRTNDDGTLKRNYEVQMLAFMGLSPDKVLLPPTAPEQADPDIAIATGKNVATAIEEMMVFNTPGRFILERSNIKADKWLKKNNKNGRITRSDIRPQYTLVTPHEAYATLGFDPPKSSGGKAGHARRRHFRTLRSERFTHAKGRVITVPATWVGPTEKVVKNKRYRVRTDL